MFCLSTHTEILVPPSPQTVALGSTASFFCSGRGVISRWFVNDTIVVNSNIDADLISRGFTFDDEEDLTAQVHNLSMTVLASQANNNTRIQCHTYLDTQVISDPVYLIIIGKLY